MLKSLQHNQIENQEYLINSDRKGSMKATNRKGFAALIIFVLAFVLNSPAFAQCINPKIKAAGPTSVCFGSSVTLNLQEETRTINFDNLPFVGSVFVPITASYEGFDWLAGSLANPATGPMYYLENAPTQNGGTYSGSVVSGTQVGYQSQADEVSTIRKSDGNTFNYKGAYFSAPYGGVFIMFKGYNINGNVETSGTELLTPTARLIELDWSNLTRLEIITTNFTSNQPWIMDNFIVGTGVYTPGQWHLNGSPVAGATSENLVANQSGPYTFVSNTGCSSNPIQVNINSEIVASATGTDVTCLGSGDGSIDLNVSGGTSPFSFSWSNGETTEDLEDLTPGTYTVIITDGMNCTQTASATIGTTVDITPPTISAPANVTVTANNAGCTAANVALGTPTANDNCAMGNISNDAPSNFPLGATTVTWTATDASGNTNTATQIVTVNKGMAAPVASILNNQSFIFLGNGSQSATFNVTNVENNVTYSWSPATYLAGANSPNPVFTPTAGEGIYNFTVTATNSFGCTTTGTLSITVVDAVCGNKNDKVMVCHKGREICVAASAVPALLAQQNTFLGSCNPTLTQINARTSNPNTTPTPADVQSFMKAYPNPFTSTTNFEFALEQDGRYKAELIDMKGQLVKVIADEEGTAGKSYSKEINSANLANGMYLIRLVTASEVKYLKLMLDK